MSLLLGLGLLLLVSAGTRAQPTSEPSTVVYLLRHAEPVFPPYEDDPPNPPLNDVGRERAAALVDVLGAAGVTTVFSSDFKRTRETAGPLADALGLEVELYDPRGLEDFAATLKRRPGRHVVAGHSNTTPRLVELLGGDPGEPIDEKREFNRLYVVVLRSDGGATTVRLRYGKP